MAPNNEIVHLTEYEKMREPHEISMDANMTSSLRPLYKEIICPICRDVLHKTVAARECLHRFCQSCIMNAIKNCLKECPVCKKKLNGKQYIKEDPDYDLLIEKIYSNGENQNHKTNKPLILPECEVVLKPLKDKKTRYIKCSDLVTIDHLAKYLSMRPDGCKNIEPEPMVKPNDYKICILKNQSKGEYEVLSGKDQLRDIRIRYPPVDTNRPIELYFHAPDHTK